MVCDLAEVLGPQPEQRGPVELGVPADVVVHLRLELVPVPVVPLLGGKVLAADEDLAGVPVVQLPGKERAAFQPEHPLSTHGQAVPEGAPPGPVPVIAPPKGWSLVICPCPPRGPTPPPSPGGEARPGG